MENPETNQYNHAQLILTKVQTQFSGGKIAFSTNGAGELENQQEKINIYINT